MKPREKKQEGLLGHAHQTVSPNSYDPDARAIKNPSPDLIEDAASKSHHGLIREEVEPARKIGREEEAKLALEHTEISRAAGWVLTLAFLLTIFSIPILQAVLEAKNGQLATSGVLQISEELPSWTQIRAVRNWQQAWDLVPTASQFKAREEKLEDDSFVAQWLLPRASGVLLHAGVGNEQVYLGERDSNGNRWLFHRPDVDYLTSKGFLDQALLRMRERAGSEAAGRIQSDPARAILDFRDQLAARNIELIVMPVPVKPMLEPEKLWSRSEIKTADFQNPSYSQFIQSLANAGVLTFDPTLILKARKAQSGESQFLQSDSHWTPDAMQEVARELSDFIMEKSALDSGQVEYSTRLEAARNLGDTARMLSLLENQKLFLKQSVDLQQVLDARGALWQSDKNAEVLLLGDSFSNIYSIGVMGWGEGAGLGAQLSRSLQRPVDAIVINAGGAHASRQQLVGEMARQPNRLAGKKIVIWQFAMRDLLFGEWKILQLPS